MGITYFPSFIVVLGIELPVGILLNVACVIYILFNLKLNSTIKHILLADTCYSLVCLVVASHGYMLVVFFDIRSSSACTLFLFPVTIAFGSSSVLTCALSWVRYKMASKASEGEIYDNPRLQVALKAGLTCLVVYQLGLTLASAFFNVASARGVVLCVREAASHMMALALINLGLIFLPLLVGLFYDIAMVKFIRQKARIQPIRLAVWTIQQTHRSSSEKDLSDAVPLKSTILNSLAMGFIIAASIVISIIDPNDQIGLNQAIIALSMARTCIHMVLVLTLIVKSQDKKQKKLVRHLPPRNLQYYDPEGFEEHP